MFRRLSTGEVVEREWTHFSFPTNWHYDVLRGLDALRSAGVEPDARVAEAVELVATTRQPDGRWPLRYPAPIRLVDGTIQSTSTWRAKATRAAGTPSVPCECWTGIQHVTSSDHPEAR